MDPTACLKRFLEACEDRDREEAADALEDLHNWIVRGGHLPKVETDATHRNCFVLEIDGPVMIRDGKIL